MLKQLIILFLFSQLLFSQSFTEYYEKLRSLESVGNVSHDVVFSVSDSRWSNKYRIDSKPLVNKIRQKLIDNNLNILEEPFNNEGFLPIKIFINIAYLNFYESSSGILFGKGILDIEITDINNTLSTQRYTVSSSVPFKGGDIDDYDDSDYSNYFIEKGDIITGELSDRFVIKVEEYLKEVMLGYRKVIAFGSAPIVNSIEQSKKSAVLDALQNSCLKVFGFKLDNITTMIDYEITDKVTTESNGHIIKYNIIEEYTRVTVDNYSCVLVEVILSNNK